jgi:hypothetical protein
VSPMCQQEPERAEVDPTGVVYNDQLINGNWPQYYTAWSRVGGIASSLSLRMMRRRALVRLSELM